MELTLFRCITEEEVFDGLVGVSALWAMGWMAGGRLVQFM